MTKKIIIAIFVVFLMAGVCSADNTVGGIVMDTVQQGEVNGGVYCDSYYYDHDQTAYDDQNIDKLFTVPDHSNVEWARLMVDVYCGHMEKNYEGWSNVTFNGNVMGNESLDVPNTLKKNGGDGYVNIGDHMNRVSSDYLMWYDVTDLVQEGNNNAFVHTEDKDNTKFDGRVIRITLVVAYDDGSDNTVYYCINQGHDVDSYYPPDDYIGSTDFSASIPSDKTVTNPTLTVVHRSSEDGTYTFNDAIIASGTPQGEYAGTNIWDIDNFNQNGVNTLTYDRVGAFYKVQLGILTAEYQGETPPPSSLSISADPTTVTIDTPTDVTFTVTDGTEPVESADITLTGCATGAGTTSTAGTAIISVNATSAGTITATASKEDYTSANTTITAQEEDVNGYKGDKPLTTYKHDTTTGDLYFSHGDSYYSGKLWNSDTDPYTVTHQVTLPSGASVEFARLYNYWTWSASGTTGQYPTMTLTFEGNTISTDVEYDDRKGWGAVYDYPAGTWAYDVTSYITGSGEYTTTVRNTDSDPDSYVCMDGIGLLIVYNDPNGQQIEYWINEGADMLSTMDTSGGVTAEEATTTSLFSGSVDLGSVESARLWTVVQSGGNEDNKLIFNAADWTGVYDATPYSDLDIDEARDVKDNLVASDNIAKIQAAPGGDYLMPSNAFLVLNIGGKSTPALSISANPTTITVSDPADVTFTVTSDGTPVEGVGISLSGCADGSGTTDATGVAVISVNATSAGTITATASKDGYTSADTTLTTKEPGQGASSSVSLSVEIKPAISFTVTPNSIDFGDLSPGETSNAQTLTLENKGGSGFTVTAQVSDNSTEDTLFKNGFLLDSAAWGDYTISLDAQTSDDTNASLSVPGNYIGVGQKQGEIVFWAQA